MPGIQFSKQVFIINCVLLIAGVLAVLAKDFETDVGGISVRVLRRSGAIKVNRKGGNKSNDIVINMDSVVEFDTSGNALGKGKWGHSFKNFANKNFTISKATNTTYQSLKCRTFTSSGFLEGPNATLTITYYIFMESGAINVGENEVGDVRRGSVKWSIQVENWKFCGSGGDNCPLNKTGENLLFTISIKSKKKPQKRKRKPLSKANKVRPDSYEIGENSTFEMSKQIKSDGKWMNMTEGYPKMEEKGNMITFKYHIPKFQNASFYDPTLSGYSVPSEDLEESKTPPENTAPNISPTYITFLALAVVFGVFLNN